MRKIISLLVFVAILILPLISYGATQPNFDTRTTWWGGVVGSNPVKVEGKTLSEISTMADYEAIVSRVPVEYKTEDGRIIYKAFPNYGESSYYGLAKCKLVDSQTWQDGKMVDNKYKEVCLPNYLGRY